MALATEIRKLRRKIGDANAPYAFDDAELSEILDEEPTLLHAIRESLWRLLTEAAKRNNYSTGLRREDKKQVFDNLLVLYKATHDEILAKGQLQIAIMDLQATGPYVAVHDYSRLLTEPIPW